MYFFNTVPNERERKMQWSVKLNWSTCRCQLVFCFSDVFVYKITTHNFVTIGENNWTDKGYIMYKLN